MKPMKTLAWSKNIFENRFLLIFHVSGERMKFANCFYLQYNKSSTDRAKEDIKSALDALNSHLLTKTFLVIIFLALETQLLSGVKYLVGELNPSRCRH